MLSNQEVGLGDPGGPPGRPLATVNKRLDLFGFSESPRSPPGFWASYVGGIIKPPLEPDCIGTLGICEGECQMIPHLLDWKNPAW
jgi:hypothetical protein